MPVSCPWVEEMVGVYDKGLSAVFFPQERYLLLQNAQVAGLKAVTA